MRKIVVIISCLIFGIFAIGFCSSLPTALGVTFGQPIQNIKAEYSKRGQNPSIENKIGLVYEKPLVPIDGVIGAVYNQYQGNLMIAKLVFDSKTMDPSATSLTSKYDDLEKIIGKKYGKPTKRMYAFGDQNYNTSQNRLIGIQTRKISYFTHWKTDNLEILLSLYGDNYKAEFSLSYYYLPLYNQWKAEQEKTKENAF